MDLLLKQKNALVCAATKGLGLAVAESLAQEGVNLFICSRDEKAVADTCRSLGERYGVKCDGIATDLTTANGLDNLFTAAMNFLGRIDILVNNVGGPPPSSAVATEVDAWRRGFDGLFLSAASLSQRVVPEMQKRKFGRIITISSLSVVEPIPSLVVSTAMRSAVTAFQKTLATEVAADGITINTVMPGVIHTQRIEQLRHAKAERNGTTFEQEMDATIQSIPAQRLGQPQELADLVCFLASPRAGYITGTNIPVDGGQRKSF